MRSTGRAALTLILALAAVAMLATALLVLREESRESARENAAAAGVSAGDVVRSFSSNEVAVPLGGAVAMPPAQVESLPPSAAEERRSASRAVARPLRSWDFPLPASRERAPCTLIVIDAQDRPVEGARVEVFGDAVKPRKHAIPFSHGGYTTERVEPVGPITSFTDAAGRCVVQGPKWGPWVVVTKDGVGTSGRVPLFPQDNGPQWRELLVPLAPYAHLRGAVLDGQRRPVAGAAIECDTRLRYVVTATEPIVVAVEPVRASTDEQGRFEVALAAAAYSIRASLAGSASKWHRITLQPGGEEEISLWLPGDWSVRGQVLRSRQAGGGPAPEARVQFWPDTGDPDSQGLHPWQDRLYARADDDGRFELPIDRPVRGRLTVEAAGGVLAEPVRVSIDAAHPHPEVTLQLGEPASISGRVVGADGLPCSGITVRADADPPLPASGRVMRKEPDIGDLWGGAKATTGEDGTFSIGGLHREGLYTVKGWVGPKEARDQLLIRSVRAGTTDLLLAADPSRRPVASVAFTARSRADGKPIGEFSIRWVARESAGDWTERESETIRDTRGLCELEDLIPDTTYWVFVTADGFGSASLESVATEEGTVSEVLLPPLGALDLHVTQAGAPAVYAHASASRAQSPLESALRGEWGASGRTDECGDKSWAALDPGTWALTVSHGGLVARRTVEVSAGQTVRVEMDLR